jgi:hypothetical protein
MPKKILLNREALVTGPYDDIVLYFKMPPNSDIVKYRAATKTDFGTEKFWGQKGNARLNLGMQMITGVKFDDDVKEDAREIENEDGTFTIFSANLENKEYYRPDWKNIFREKFGMYVETLVGNMIDAAQVKDVEEKNDSTGK